MSDASFIYLLCEAAEKLYSQECHDLANAVWAAAAILDSDPGAALSPSSIAVIDLIDAEHRVRDLKSVTRK